MRLLVHGMQSSGATTFTQMLAQRPDCLALVDITNRQLAPRVTSDLDFVAKVVVTTKHPLAAHVERFRPDKTVLLLRDPRDNYRSLMDKDYRDGSGTMDEKFALLDALFATRAQFDAVIEYEDFVARDPAVLAAVNALGWPVEPGFHHFTRRHDEFLAALWQHEPGLVAEMMREMSFVFGNVRGRDVSTAFRDKPRDAGIERRLDALCPQLLAHYRAKRD